MDSLTFLVVIVFGIPLSVFILSTVSGAVYVAYQSYQYRQKYPDVQKLRSNLEKTITELENIKPYIQIKPDLMPFAAIDRAMFSIFEKISFSLNQTEQMVYYLPLRTEAIFNRQTFNLFRSWKLGTRLRLACNKISEKSNESRSWQKQINKLLRLVEMFDSLKSLMINQTERDSKLVESIQKRLLSLQTNRTVGLETQEKKVTIAEQMLNNIQAILQNSPDPVPESTHIPRYRLAICELFSVSEELRAICQDTGLSLHQISRAQKWCTLHLESIQKRQQKLEDLLAWVNSLGLELSEIAEERETLIHNLEEATMLFSERTPPSYEVLCGSLLHRGSKDALLLHLEETQLRLLTQVQQFKDAYLHAKSKVEDMQKNIQQEILHIEKIESNQYKLDLSRDHLSDAERYLKKAISLRDSGKLLRLRQVNDISIHCQNSLDNSAKLREDFIKQEQTLADLQSGIFLKLNPIGKRLKKVTSELEHFRHDFFNGVQDLRELLNNTYASIYNDFTESCNINLTIQSEVQEAYAKALSAIDRMNDLDQEVTSLETTQKEYHVLFQELDKWDIRISEQWKKPLECRSEEPLPDWIDQFDLIVPRVRQWQDQWRVAPGRSYTYFIEQAQTLEKDILRLAERHRLDKEHWKREVEKSLLELSQMWHQIEVRSQKMPRSSIEIETVERRIQHVYSDYKLLEKTVRPLECRRFWDTLNSHIESVMNKKQDMENEDQQYESACNRVKKATERVNKAVKGYHDITKAAEESGWPIIDELDNLSDLLEDFHEQEQYLSHLLSENLYTAADLTKKYNDISDQMASIKNSISKEHQGLSERYQELTALNGVVENLLAQLQFQASEEDISIATRRRFNHRINEMSRLRSDARTSKTYSTCRTFLELAIDKARFEVPGPVYEQILNHFNFYDQRQVEMWGTGLIYNEKSTVENQTGNISY